MLLAAGSGCRHGLQWHRSRTVLAAQGHLRACCCCGRCAPGASYLREALDSGRHLRISMPLGTTRVERAFLRYWGAITAQVTRGSLGGGGDVRSCKGAGKLDRRPPCIDVVRLQSVLSRIASSCHLSCYLSGEMRGAAEGFQRAHTWRSEAPPWLLRSPDAPLTPADPRLSMMASRRSGKLENNAKVLSSGPDSARNSSST